MMRPAPREKAPEACAGRSPLLLRQGGLPWSSYSWVVMPQRVHVPVSGSKLWPFSLF